MFESVESKRYTKLLHNLLLKIFHERLEDPIFDRLTVNHVRLNRNKTIATVYVDAVGCKNSKLVVNKLNRLNGLFRNALSEHLDKYRIPFLRFVEDRLLDNAKRVEYLIESDLENA